MMLQWTENRFFLFHFKERTNKKYDMANMTIHRQPTLLLFHNSIWLLNPNYFKFSLLFFFHLINNDLLFWARNSKTTDLIPKGFSFFLLTTFRKRKLFFRDVISLDWKWPVIGTDRSFSLPTGRSSQYKSPLEGSIFKSEVGVCHRADLPLAG